MHIIAVSFLKRFLFLMRMRFYLPLLIIPFILYIRGVNKIVIVFLYLILFSVEYCLYRWKENSRHLEGASLLKGIVSERKSFYTDLYKKAGMANPYPDIIEFGARTVDKVNPAHHLRKVTVRYMVDEFEIKQKRLIDIGGLDGNISVEYAVDGNEVFITDLDIVSLKEAKKRIDCPCFISDISSLPIRASAFDFVSLLEVIEHLKDPVKGIREIYRIMRKGGRILLTTDSRNTILPYYIVHPFILAEKIIGLFFQSVLTKPVLVKKSLERDFWYPHTTYSKREIEDLLIENGLQVKYLSCYHYFPDLHLMVLGWIKLMRHFMSFLNVKRKGENKSLTEEEYVRLIFPIERGLRKIPLIRWLGAHWFVIAEKT